jgi:hypothetical protein
VNVLRVRLQLEGYIGAVPVEIRKIFLNHVALVTETHNKISDAVDGVPLHNVPQEGAATNLDQRLRASDGFLANSRSKATC